MQTVLRHGDACLTEWQSLCRNLDNGLYKLNADGSAEQLISGTLSNAVHHIHQLYNNSNKYILIASDDGLVEYDIQNRSWSMLSEVERSEPEYQAERFVYGIAGDNEGGIWVTTLMVA